MPSEVKTAGFRAPRPRGSATRGVNKLQNFQQPEKQEEMYPINWPSYDNNDVEKTINGILGPLSLFAPFPHEDMHEEEPELELERPVTPIDEEIKSQPTSFDKLASYIKRRLCPRPDIPHLSFEDQQCLAGILIGEVTGVWPEIRKQVDDPFLTPEENRELNRRIAVHIVTVCEQLFLHYLKKAEVLNSRGIFSGPANMSRLKAQLSLDANKFLNILMVRRYIVADIRGQQGVGSPGSDDFLYEIQPRASTAAAPQKMSYKTLIETSRPKSKTMRFRFKSPENEARKIVNQMPNLDVDQVNHLVAQMPDRHFETPSYMSESTPREEPGRDTKMSGVSMEERSKQQVVLKRSNSLPDIQPAETLLEELGISPTLRQDKIVEQELALLKKENQKNAMSESSVSSQAPKPGTLEYRSQDLQRLLAQPEDEIESDKDMPPLLQAITRSAKHDGQKEVLEKKLKELQEKERREHQQRSIPLREPKHPQPAVVKTKLSNQMEVRASDIRVSERVCMSSISLNRYATVYNDLIDEIDVPTVKMLDRNLFLGDEIREVYHEIMRTIPNTHMNLDDDENVVVAADDVNISGTMASASLVKKRTERVINPAFAHDHAKPPWGDQDQKQWVKTPNHPPKNFQGDDVFSPLTPNMERVHEVLRSPQKMNQLVEATEDFPSYVQDKVARTYASWLQWWKSTITSDDYLKYLSTQETDYMGAVFHFYDSGDEDDEDDIPAVTSLYPTRGTTGAVYLKSTTSPHTQVSKHTEIKEKERKFEELKAQKSEFKEGFWNVNAVLLGGLGKDPVIEEEEDDTSGKPPKSADTQRSAKTLAERAAARHSAKLDKSREISQSRASKVTTLTATSKHDTEHMSESDVEEAPPSPQERLEKVWTSLQMPDSLKLDMAIKYSCNEFFNKLTEAIEKWERITNMVLKREELLVKLEKFERLASDPNRFFVKGQKRSSVERLKEAQQRSYYYKRIDAVDVDIKQEIDYVKTHFRDVITYKGRPYSDKMKWDRIEMLHWLQEERKENAIKYEALMKHVPLKSAQLEPIPIALPSQKVA